MPLPQELKKRKSINGAGNCNEDSCCVAASSQCSYAFIPLCLHFLPFSLFLSITLFSLTQIKHSLWSLPTQTGMQRTAAKLLKRKRKKASQSVGSFPPPFTGGPVALCLSVCLLSQTQDAPGASVTRSYSAALPSASATGVNDHVFCCHSSRALDCFCRRSMPRQGFFYQYLSLSLSLPQAAEQASEAGRQAGGQAGRQEAKSVYSNYLAETLPANPSNTPKASPFLPTSLWQRPAPYHVQPMKQQLLQICVSPLEEHRLSDGVKTALQYNNP